MTEINREEAIQVFQRLVKSLSEEPSLTAREILNQFTQFYRDTPIVGSKTGETWDALLLEWGVSHPLLIDRFTDFSTPQEVNFDSTSYQWLGLTRCTTIEDEEGDDGTGIRLNMYFDPSIDKQKSSSMFIEAPEDIPAALVKLIAVPYVDLLLSCRPSRISAYMDNLG